MLIITEEYMRKNINIKDILDSIEKALLIQEKGNFIQPDRIHLGDENPFLLMPCFKEDFFSTKLVTVYPKNSEILEPVTQGVTLLNDINTGKPLALLNATYMTGLRTGCVGGISAKYLAKPNASNLGVIGAGVQSIFQVLAICSVRNIKNVYIFSKTSSKIDSFIEILQKDLSHINFHKCNNSTEVAQMSDIIVCATTSTTPVLPDDENLYKGKHIIAIGSYEPHTRELPNSLIKCSDYIFTDTMFALKESGDLLIPLTNNLIKENDVKTLGKVILNFDENLQNATTIFKSVGIGLFDLCCAESIYKIALKNNDALNVNL